MFIDDAHDLWEQVEIVQNGRKYIYRHGINYHRVGRRQDSRGNWEGVDYCHDKILVF